MDQALNGAHTHQNRPNQGIKREADGFVYFITDGVAVKIGFAVSPEHRRRDLQTSHYKPLSIIAAFAADRREEGVLHRHFHALRQSGEWFRLDPRIDDFIAEARLHESKIRERRITLTDVVNGRHNERLAAQPKSRAEVAAFEAWFKENDGKLFDGSSRTAKRALLSVQMMKQENFKYAKAIHQKTKDAIDEFMRSLAA